MPEAEEFYTDERCHIRELSNTADDPHLSIAQARVISGVVTRWHQLVGITERYVIMEGEGRMEVGELPPRTVRPGDVVLIPPGCRQRIANTGDTDLIFLAICSPRFTSEAYQDIECDPPDNQLARVSLAPDSFQGSARSTQHGDESLIFPLNIQHNLTRPLYRPS